MDSFDLRSIKPCTSAPACTAHRHRPRPPPCPQPETCYYKSIRSKKKCPNAMATINRRGTLCGCPNIARQFSHKRRTHYNRVTHRGIISRAYNQRSKESRWSYRSKCCTIL